MPLQAVGNKLMDGNRVVEHGIKSHTEAVSAGREHGKKTAAGRTTSVSFEPSVGVELFFNRKDFQSVEFLPSEAEAVAAAVQKAMDDGGDPEALKAVYDKTAAQHAAEQAMPAEAKFMTESFRHQGVLHESGWIVIQDGQSFVLSDEEYQARVKVEKKNAPLFDSGKKKEPAKDSGGDD